MSKKHIITFEFVALFLLSMTLFCGCEPQTVVKTNVKNVPHESTWGIYELDLATQKTNLVYSSPTEIFSSTLRLNTTGTTLIFAQKFDGTSDNNLEICTVNTDGTELKRITDNSFWDIYPAWSPDEQQIAFLSKRNLDLDIYLMDADGDNARLLYDSGGNDADIDWAGDKIVFTAQSAIWMMAEDGTEPVRITDPPGRGEWGEANLPKGDYDPRLTTDGKKIVFERLEDNGTANGGYNLFTINIDGTGETRLTNNYYAQGIAGWSHSGDKIVYVIAAIEGTGKYDMYIINSDGTDNHNITPSYFPNGFLCHSPCFSADDSKIYFIGQWYE